MAGTRKIATHLWFNDNAEEAVAFYTSLFGDARITNVVRWGAGGPGPQGAVLNIAFEMAGQSFIALNGGPALTFTPAISLSVSCESQADVDELCFECAGVVRDHTLLKKLFELFATTLDRLRELNAAAAPPRHS